MACSNCDDLGLRVVDGRLEECPCGSNLEWAREFAPLRDGGALELLHGTFVDTPFRKPQ